MKFRSFLLTTFMFLIAGLYSVSYAGTCGGDTMGSCDQNDQWCECANHECADPDVLKCVDMVATECGCVGGGGGTACVGGVSCPNGWTTNKLQPLYSDYCDQSSPTTCSIGNAQSKGACCGKQTCDDGGNCTGCARNIVTTYACCPPGTEDGCVITDTGTSYTYLTDPNFSTTCREDWDVFESTTQSDVIKQVFKKMCNGEWYYNEKKGRDECSGELYDYTVYYYNTTCKDFTKTCSCIPICTAGTEPTLTTPADGAIYSGPSGGASVAFDWEAPTDWGLEASGTNRSYTLCAGTNSTDPCSGGQTFSVGSGSTPDSGTTQTITAGNKYWAVKANNMCGSASVLSSVRNICIEGNTLPGDAGVGNAYYSQWGACDPNTHKRTRTCTEDCGTDNCTAAASAGHLEEDCTAEIRGTIFDATNLSSCPSFDPTTGYLIGVDTTLTANNRTFDMADQSNVPTHPWPLITTPTTDSSGNYSVRVYAPTTYTYDFNSLKDIYIVGTGPKLTCTSAVAVAPTSPTNCGTQPCSTVNNMSFGFERYWGGWWQVQGAGVHAETGLRSSIPTALPSEQSLILPEPSTGNRRGIVSYGISSDTILGVNTNAKVSSSLWKALSNYDGVIYDYAYFNQQFKKYATTAWDGVSSLSYDDNGNGYQIFKVSGSVTDFNYNPTGTQKVIFLVSGDVTINSNIVVPNGAFLAVLAGGTINIRPNVTSVDGWYLADTIAVRCLDANSDIECDRTDVQFVGNGSFVGWEGIVLTRDRGGDTNILGPSEKFNYRLDLYNSAPDPMKIFTKKYKPYVP